MKLILGIIGKNGSGKTAATEYLKKKYQAVSFRFSDPLKDILDRLHLDNSRGNFQTLSTVIRQNFGEDILSLAIAEEVKKSNERVIIAEGVRRPTDIKYLKTLPGFHLLYVKADQKIRFERVSGRKEKTDDQSKTWEEFLKEEEQEPEKQIDEIAKQADYMIDNNGTLEDLYKQLDKIISGYESKNKKN